MLNPEEGNISPAQMTMMRVLARQPLTIMDLLNQFDIPWERKTIDEQDCVIIKWKEFMVGEQKIKDKGPVLKELMDELKAQGISFKAPEGM
jgi:hypothetical protein